MPSIPLVGIQAGHAISRAKSLDCKGQGLTARPLITLSEALETRWDFDAHFFSYHLSGSNPPPIPTVIKGVLSLIREKGADLETSILAIDMDVKGHQPWTLQKLENFLKVYDRKIAHEQFIPPAYFYTTRNGIRLLYILENSIPVDEAEQYHKGLTDLLNEHTFPHVELDVRCSNWERVFRLPQVVRDGVRSWESDLYLYHEEPNTYLDLTQVPKTARKITTVSVDLPEVDQPSDSEAFRLMYTKRNHFTEWHKTAKHFLKGRQCFSCCFEGGVIAKEGHRDSTIQSYVGQACALLCHLDLATPQRIYSLFIDSVSDLEPDTQTSDWTLVLWNSVLKYFHMEQAKQEQEQEQRQEIVQTTEGKLDHIADRMKDWCDSPIMHGNNQDLRRDFVKKHLICMTSNSYFVMTPTGTYHKIGTTKPHELPALISRLGMQDLIPLREMSGQTIKNIAPMEILSRHGTKIGNVEGSLSARGCHIQAIDSEDAKLVMDLFRLKSDLLQQAQPHPEVQRWLESLVSGDDYPTLIGWIANALAFDEGSIAALSLTGPPGVGKKLIVQGLAECITTELVASSKEFCRFGGRLLRTCFLNVNEGLPKPTQGMADVADTFRHFVSGDVLSIEEKYKPVISVRNPLRILFTTNNTDVVHQLAGHRELSPYDQEALAIRLIHVETQQRAADYLRALGGIYYTGKDGGRWIGGDQGQPSDFIVAKHFMHLYKTERFKHRTGDRFLMEGSMHSGLIEEMKLRMGISPQIIECMISMVENPNPASMTGFTVIGYKVFVTNHGVATYYKKLFNNEKLNIHSLRKVMNSITLNPIKCRKLLPSGNKSDNLYWKELDLLLLLSEAEKHGFDHGRLQSLVTAEMGGMSERLDK